MNVVMALMSVCVDHINIVVLFLCCHLSLQIKPYVICDWCFVLYISFMLYLKVLQLALVQIVYGEISMFFIWLYDILVH